MSVEEEEEDSVEKDSEVEQTGGATRAKWVKDDVEQLRAENRIELLKQNAAAYDPVVGNGGQPGRSRG